MITYRQRFSVFMGAVAFALLTLGAAPKAHAWLRVCNDLQTAPGGEPIGIWFTLGLSDSTCSNAGHLRRIGWFKIPANTCQFVSNANMNGKWLYTYAITANYITFEWAGTTSWSTPQTSFNTCHTNVQLSCSNPGSGCMTRRYQSQWTTSPDVTVRYVSVR